jgi:AcrR family transcriptional regulator
MKDAILGAAVEVLVIHGLNNWTIEEVANRAHCAKGLVNYHYRSKQGLLIQAAETLRDDRAAHRLAAVQSHGAQAVDRLWGTLRAEVESGWFAAWASLVTADTALRKAAVERPADGATVAAALSHSLDLGHQLVPRATLIQAALNGLELALLQGVPAAEAEEAYHRFWLTVVP